MRSSLLVFKNLEADFEGQGCKENVGGKQSTNTCPLLVDIVQKQLVGWKEPFSVSCLLLSAGALISSSSVLLF